MAQLTVFITHSPEALANYYGPRALAALQKVAHVQRGDAAAVIERIRVRTGLLNEVGDGRWLRMHPLLREHALRRLTLEDPARLADYRARAARALAREGELQEAAELALDAEAWSQARELIEGQVEALNGRGAWSLLAGWLERLPADQLAEAPDLALLQARVAIRLMRLPEAHAMLDAVSAIEGLTVHGVTDRARLDERVPTLAFTVEGQDSGAIARGLARRDV